MNASYCVVFSRVHATLWPTLSVCRSVRPYIRWSYTLFFLYKHLVYKHAQPQILGKFKHIAKHAPGSVFRFKKFFQRIYKNMPIFRYFWLEYHKNQWKLWKKLKSYQQYQTVSTFRILILIEMIGFLIIFKNIIA